MNEIEFFLNEILGNYKKKVIPKENGNNFTYRVSYSKPIIGNETIHIIVISPYVWERCFNDYVINKKENCFYFLLYDNETDIIIGDIVEIIYDFDWKDEISFFIYTCNDRIDNYTCPQCGFWLVQRINMYGHKFIGCSGFPDCTHSFEIDRYK